MSREVIGAGTTDGAGPLPLPRGQTPPATVTDLDAPPNHPVAEPPPDAADPTVGGGGGPAGAGRPARRSAWSVAVQGWPAGPVKAVSLVVAGLLVGALLGTGVAERSAAQRRNDAVRLVGGLAYPTSGFVGGSSGGVMMDVLVVNAGPETVRVTGASFADGSTGTLELSEPFEVAPGTSARSSAQAQFDCDRRVLPTLAVAVQTPDGRTREAALEASGLGGMLVGGDLTYLCETSGNPSTVNVFSTVSQADGSLRMQVRNGAAEAVDLTFEGPVGVTILGDPPFPVTVEASSSEFLVLRVQVDACTAAATRADAGNDLRLLADGVRDQAFLDPVVTAGWLARQVALACPQS